jgi:hypothetical protein
MEQGFWKAVSRLASQVIPHFFIKAEHLLLHSQDPRHWSHPEPDESGPHPRVLFLQDPV